MKQTTDKDKNVIVSNKDLKHVAGGDRKIRGGNEDIFSAGSLLEDNPFLKPRGNTEGE